MVKHECPNAHCSHADVIVRNTRSVILDVNEYDVEIEYCPYCGKYLLGTFEWGVRVLSTARGGRRLMDVELTGVWDKDDCIEFTAIIRTKREFKEFASLMDKFRDSKRFLLYIEDGDA